MSVKSGVLMAKKELEILLRATKINKSFGNFVANKDIDISIAKGQIHALLGENGAGKSTLVKIFYGVLQPDKGSIEINNQKVTITSPNVARKNGIGMVFQHFSLFPALTVAENILIALDKKIKFNKVVDEITKLSNEWELFVDPLKLVSELSVGEKQRVEIIRCLMQNPNLLIMDEPTSVLTPQEIKNLFKIKSTLLNYKTNWASRRREGAMARVRIQSGFASKASLNPFWILEWPGP